MTIAAGADEDIDGGAWLALVGDSRRLRRTLGKNWCVQYCRRNLRSD